MTLGRAKGVLVSVWVAGFTFLCATVGLQTLFGKFGNGEEWDTGFAWFFPLGIPPLTLMLTVWTTQQTREDQDQVAVARLLGPALVLSIFYIVSMLGVLALHPFADVSLQMQFRRSAWYLAVLQSVVMMLLGRLFVL